MAIKWTTRAFRGDSIGVKRAGGGFHFGITLKVEGHLQNFSMDQADEWFKIIETAYNWCCETIGPQKAEWDTSFDLSSDSHEKIRFCFKEEKMRVLFKLALAV